MTEQKEISYLDENGEINHDAKMSEKFRYFVYDDEMSGTEDIIRETNDKVAEGNMAVHEWLDDGYGAKYFYECMELARKVILSFESESEPAETFKVGEYYSFDDGKKVFKVLCNTDDQIDYCVYDVSYSTLKTWCIPRKYMVAIFPDSVPAKVEEIALFKRAEHFHSKGRKLNEFRVGDVVLEESKHGFVTEIENNSDVLVHYTGELMQTLYIRPLISTLYLIMTAEELEAAAMEVKG